jgi:ketosteroid isomerase-like protein
LPRREVKAMRVLRAAVLLVAAATLHVPDMCFSQGGPDEVAIRNVIETWVQAVNNEGLPTLLDQFSDDATIDSKIARARLDKQKYGEAMAAAFRTHALVGMAADSLKITFVDQTHAALLARIYPMSNARRYVYVVEWRLEKRDGRWIIVEASYKSTEQEPVVWFDLAGNPARLVNTAANRRI